jgi:acyl carrier protein
VHDMDASVREFILTTLKDKMMLPVDRDSVTPDTPLGPEGMDLESLAIVELSVHLENEFGVTFGDEDTETLAEATLGDLCRLVASRASAPQTT